MSNSKKNESNTRPFDRILAGLGLLALAVTSFWLKKPALTRSILSWLIPTLIILLVILIVIGIIIAVRRDKRRNKEHDLRLSDEKRAREKKRAQAKDPRWILSHNPSLNKIKRILKDHPHDNELREMAFQAAIKSGNASCIIMLSEYFPERREKIMDFYTYAYLENKPEAEQIAWIEEHRDFLSSGHRKCWLEWAEDRRSAARRAAQWREKLRQAEADGESVCWKCETINPHRCWCGVCISDKGGCTNYSGYCYAHDD